MLFQLKSIFTKSRKYPNGFYIQVFILVNAKGRNDYNKQYKISTHVISTSAIHIVSPVLFPKATQIKLEHQLCIFYQIDK